MPIRAAKPCAGHSRVSNATSRRWLEGGELRKDFTVSERVAIAKAIEERLAGRVGNPNLTSIPEKFPELPKGDSRDLAAKKAGFGSGKTAAMKKTALEGRRKMLRGELPQHSAARGSRAFRSGV